MSLKRIPTSELVRLTQHTVVASYCIFFDQSGKGVIWKLRFENGREQSYFIPPAVAVHFTKSARRTAKMFGWPNSEEWLENFPNVTDQERNFRNYMYGMATGCRVEAFRDSLVVALLFPKGLVQVIRLSPKYAVQIAALHWDAIGKGILKDIAAEAPPTSTRH